MGELYGLELDLNTAVIKKQNKTVLPKPRERTRISRADRLFGEMTGGNCVSIFCISGLWAQGWDAGWRSGCLAWSPQCFGGGVGSRAWPGCPQTSVLLPILPLEPVLLVVLATYKMTRTYN